MCLQIITVLDEPSFPHSHLALHTRNGVRILCRPLWIYCRSPFRLSSSYAMSSTSIRRHRTVAVIVLHSIISIPCFTLICVKYFIYQSRFFLMSFTSLPVFYRSFRQRANSSFSVVNFSAWSRYVTLTSASSFRATTSTILALFSFATRTLARCCVNISLLFSASLYPHCKRIICTKVFACSAFSAARLECKDTFSSFSLSTNISSLSYTLFQSPFHQPRATSSSSLHLQSLTRDAVRSTAALSLTHNCSIPSIIMNVSSTTTNFTLERVRAFTKSSPAVYSTTRLQSFVDVSTF